LHRILCFIALRRLIALAALCLALQAEACLFARDAKPADWLAWSSALFAADVSEVVSDKGTDNIWLRVVETFKGPAMAEKAMLQVPMRLWAACKLERPAIGARVLVALNPNSDALLVPLAPAYLQELRKAAGR
jgi:hypothetical protein